MSTRKSIAPVELVSAGPPRMMCAISSRSPNARCLLDQVTRLAAHLHAKLFVVHVRQPMTLHYRRAATVCPIPKSDLAYAAKLGARVVIESGDVIKALVRFARTMGIAYFVTGRSKRSRLSLTWKLPLTETLQRKLPGTTIIII